MFALCVFSGLEGASQTLAAKVEEHRRTDDQNDGADEENARVCCRERHHGDEPHVTVAFLTLTLAVLCVPSSLCFQFLLPVIQVSLICLCIGGDPKGIQVAVVNNETSPSAYSHSLLSFLDNSSVQQVFI